MASLKDFQILSKLGEGAYSSVYKVKRKEDNQEYALKKVNLQNLSDKEKQNALNEVRILASIRNPNIICYKEAFIDEQNNYLCIVMEYANNGDLYQYLVEHQKKGKYFEEDEIWSIMIQILKGLKALHELKILHRDLKSANVFLNKDGQVKLGDLNVSKVAKKGLLYTQTGTPYYASPEVWKEQPYDSKSDIWSLGCVIYEMTTLKPPFRAEDMEGLYKKVIRGYYPKIPGHYSLDLNNIIRAMLQVSPHLRPSCSKILSLPSVVSRLEQNQMHFYETDEGMNNQLLKTINIPKKLYSLSDALPKANYNPMNLNKINKQRSMIDLQTNQIIPQSQNDLSMEQQYNQKNQRQARSVENNLPNIQKVNQNKNTMNPQSKIIELPSIALNNQNNISILNKDYTVKKYSNKQHNKYNLNVGGNNILKSQQQNKQLIQNQKQMMIQNSPQQYIKQQIEENVNLNNSVVDKSMLDGSNFIDYDDVSQAQINKMLKHSRNLSNEENSVLTNNNSNNQQTAERKLANIQNIYKIKPLKQKKLGDLQQIKKDKSLKKINGDHNDISRINNMYDDDLIEQQKQLKVNSLSQQKLPSILNNKNTYDQQQDQNDSKQELNGLYKLILKNDPILKEKYKKNHHSLMINGKGTQQQPIMNGQAIKNY